ncbi:hypothetical protein AVEN_101697-1 [Araneus ventricosus]|uniref:Uncharacterized protein n=1 Tax=Araneus ventricosus TaxID=182803 RepID=A0A4Y2J7V1_ARAVE|nr:hypothetical protein AVEN_101697-1 [Araneus ventricosus]
MSETVSHSSYVALSVPSYARVASVGRVLFLHTNKPITAHSYADPATCHTETVLLSLCSNLQYLQSLVKKTKGEILGYRSCAVFDA